MFIDIISRLKERRCEIDKVEIDHVEYHIIISPSKYLKVDHFAK